MKKALRQPLLPPWLQQSELLEENHRRRRLKSKSIGLSFTRYNTSQAVLVFFSDA